jgi:hypothetical protein
MADVFEEIPAPNKPVAETFKKFRRLKYLEDPDFMISDID